MLFPEINHYLDSLIPSVEGEERMEKWNALGRSLKKSDMKGAVNFICTHNARRSVLSQSLATAIAYRTGLNELEFWSGGAEATFVHPNSIATLQRIGFRLLSKSQGNNPIYELAYADDAAPLKIFSKTFDDLSSPAPYHAVMVCSKGDAACPFIPGVASRTLIPFEDPGAFDGTPEEEKAYHASAAQIGSEMRYFFEKIIP
ncbi:MAG TPA: protein-tyrosine-phosphatase [Bacteroidetes bacterium]|nr:protein-tyrosine-phosphatase [Bacteroidota bacterium]